MSTNKNELEQSMKPTLTDEEKLAALARLAYLAGHFPKKEILHYDVIAYISNEIDEISERLKSKGVDPELILVNTMLRKDTSFKEQNNVEEKKRSDH